MTAHVTWQVVSPVAGWVGIAVRGLNFHANNQADLILLSDGPFFVYTLNPVAGDANRLVYDRCFPTTGDDSHGLISADAWVVNCEVTGCPFPPNDFPVGDPPNLARASIDCHWGHVTQCNG